MLFISDYFWVDAGWSSFDIDDFIIEITANHEIFFGREQIELLFDSIVVFRNDKMVLLGFELAFRDCYGLFIHFGFDFDRL